MDLSFVRGKFKPPGAESRIGMLAFKVDLLAGSGAEFIYNPGLPVRGRFSKVAAL